MKLGHRTALALGMLCSLPPIVASGCKSRENCEDNGTCLPGGESPAVCAPSPVSGAVVDACGVFVSSSLGKDLEGEGTLAAPYKSLKWAIEKAGTRPIYACGEMFKEELKLTTGAVLYGALDCANGWAYTAARKTTLTADADKVPLTLVSSASGTEIHDFAISAQSASVGGAGVAGGSSIAIIDDSASLTLDNVDVTAANGAAGRMMQSAPPRPTSAPEGWPGGALACTQIAGGRGGANMCGGVATRGGDGGVGKSDFPGAPGHAGVPHQSLNGGHGQKSAFMPCADGKTGNHGALGAPGDGATGIGTIDADGYHGNEAHQGADGKPGQGGGGGGGLGDTYGYACVFSAPIAPSGGGGGAGGCGGPGGAPGAWGGSSIGILVLDATLTMRHVTVTTATGGDGSPGGDGQPGELGGTGGIGGPVGMGTVSACSGGKGGNGGPGGQGGGGAGGHSVGIAFRGGARPDTSGATFNYGAPGSGGLGTDVASTGADGLACQMLDFAAPSQNPLAGCTR